MEHEIILFIAPGASSLAPHILLREARVPFSIERVDLATRTWSGGRFDAINPKSYVPALQLDSGAVLAECAVVLQYVADLRPEQGLIPRAGDFDRYRHQEWLNFIATEVHKNFITPERHGGVSANFLSKTPEGQARTRTHVAPRLAWIDRTLGGSEFLAGDRFSAVDAYLFTMLTWATRLGFDLPVWPNLQRYFTQLRSRPCVVTALDVEGPPHALRE